MVYDNEVFEDMQERKLSQNTIFKPMNIEFTIRYIYIRKIIDMKWMISRKVNTILVIKYVNSTLNNKQDKNQYILER